MLGWPTRWDSSSVGRDPQQQHHAPPHPSSSSPGLTVTDQVVAAAAAAAAAAGRDHLPRSSPISTPASPFSRSAPHNSHSTPPHNHADHYLLRQTHNQIPSGCSSSHLGFSKGGGGSLDAGPFSNSGPKKDFVLNHDRSHSHPSPPPPHLPDPVLLSHNSSRYPIAIISSSVPSCSASSSSSSKPLPGKGGTGHIQYPAIPFSSSSSSSTSSFSSELESPSTSSAAVPEGSTKNNNHSFSCHAAPTPVLVPPTSLNGTSRPPLVVSRHLDENSPWEEVAETAPLTATNGEVGRFRVNGVVTTMPVKEDEMPKGEEEGEEEEEDEEEDGEEECEEEEEEEELKCGLGKWCSPPWVQRLANKQMFLMVFCLTSVLQGMFYTYFVSVLTTIEKLFQLKSKTTGIIMSATEMGQIGGALLLTYYGGHGHRPKWIGWGIVLFAFCALLCSLPHFLLSPELLKKHLEITPSLNNPLDSANTCKLSKTDLIASRVTIAGGGGVVLEGENNGTFPEGVALEDSGPCEETRDSQGVLAIFFISLLGVGIGQTAAYNLGIPYIDDNVDNRETPLYFAGTSGVRILGPTLGFVLGSFCTRLYVNPMTDPGITTSDPRWIGAWWLGLVFVSVALFLTSTAMFAFPRRLPSSPRTVRTVFQAQRRNPSLRDFPKAVRRLLKNDILMLRTASSVLHILPIAGLYTFLPKYLESQFRLPVHSAAMVSGIGGILVMGLGIFASGVFIRKAKPSARAVAGWIALTALVYSIGMVILMFVGCAPDDLLGLKENKSGKYFEPECNRTCGSCDDNMYAPVCDSDGKTHFSACHLGCTNATHIEGSNKLMFSNCECLKEENGTAELRLCELNCGNFVWYVIIFSVFVLIHSTSEVGGMLVTLRCVDPKDKAMALGLISVAIGLFGNVPCPIIYGAVVDSACIHWKEGCKELGACQLYDSYIFRMFFHGMTGAVMLLAFMVDVVVWHKAKSVSFNEDEDGPEETTLMNPKSSSQSTPVVTEQTPTTSTAQEISPVGSTSGGEASVSREDQSESCV